MSDEELRHYFLRYREDKRAFRVYLDRLSERPRRVITTVNDPDFDAKILNQQFCNNFKLLMTIPFNSK